MREAVDHARGHDWLRWSTTHIGHRLTGSPQGQRAEETSDSLFRLSPGASTKLFPFSATAWDRGSVQLTMEDRDGAWHLAAVALANTPDSSMVDAELVDAGNGLPADLIRLGDGLSGRAALINLGLLNPEPGAENLHRSEKAALAMQRGAAGIVFVNNVDGGVLLTGTASVTGEPIPIPAVCITSEDGAALRERLARGSPLRTRISMHNRSGPVQARNVIAEIPGTDLVHEVILVGGHLDSWDLATGATDNGLGAYSILDMHRALLAHGAQPRRTLRFVLFMGEEQGLLGSKALVTHYQETGQLERVRCMINLDMTGDPFGFGIAGPAGWSGLIDTLNGRIRQADDTFRGEVSSRPWLHSDHQPFLLAGVPVINPMSDLGGHVYGCYHSSCDDIHLVEPRAMVNNVARVGALALLLASANELPPPFTEQELMECLRGAGLEEKLRLSREWRW